MLHRCWWVVVVVVLLLLKAGSYATELHSAEVRPAEVGLCSHYHICLLFTEIWLQVTTSAVDARANRSQPSALCGCPQ